MLTYDTFKKRKQRAENAGKPVLYRDDIWPQAFRIQVAHIWRRTIGSEDGWFAAGMLNLDTPWAKMNETLATEMGLFTLWEGGLSNRA